jgi:hypothetical protein
MIAIAKAAGGRLALSAGAALAVILLALGGGPAWSDAVANVVPLPAISVHSSAIRIDHRRVLLVTSILLGNIEGVRPTITCGRCERIRATLRESHPTAASKRYIGVDWLIPTDRHILVEVTHQGQIGRYLLLGVGDHDALVYKDAGCLTPATGARMTCPQTATTVPKEGAVAGGNPGSTGPAETPAEAEKKVKVEEEAVKKAEETAAKKKAEEAAAKKKAEEAAATKKQTEEAAAKKKAQEEAAAKKKSEEEAAARKKSEEEAAARKRAEEEANRTFSETPGSEVNTWSDYADGGGTHGPTIPSHETVQVKCRVEGLRVSDGNTWWYRIASSPWNDAYYGSADAFYNEPGVTSGSLVGTPFYEAQVPIC